MKEFGDMPMPAGFRYRDVYLKGKPQHDRFDTFRIRHPSMDVAKRAKIFAPFDALKGFGEAVAARNILYEAKKDLCEEDREELDRRLRILHNLTWNGRMARANQFKVTITCYVPCRDENSNSYGQAGRYETITGICMNVDAELTRTIRIGEQRIRLEDILRIENSDGIFERAWDEEYAE